VAAAPFFQALGPQAYTTVLGPFHFHSEKCVHFTIVKQSSDLNGYEKTAYIDAITVLKVKKMPEMTILPNQILGLVHAAIFPGPREVELDLFQVQLDGLWVHLSRPLPEPGRRRRPHSCLGLQLLASFQILCPEI
jgi:hypothetical protein